MLQYVYYRCYCEFYQLHVVLFRHFCYTRTAADAVNKATITFPFSQYGLSLSMVNLLSISFHQLHL